MGLDEELVDRDALRTYLERELGGDGDLTVERHMQGHSNETFFVTWDGRELVLRRPPLGTTLPTAHDVLREYTVLDALDGTDVPTPSTVRACDDESVLGKPFYLMEKVPGTVPRDGIPDGLDDPANRRRIGEELVDALAGIHTVDLDAVGLDGFGKGAGYTGRQVDLWTNQMEFTLGVTADEVRDVPELRETSDWLADNLPDEPATTLVHGDYKLDNVVVAPDPPAEIAAVLDWEMSTLGNPLADVGWMLIFWRDPGDPETDLSSIMPEFTERDGFPTRKELVERYRKQTGFPVRDLTFYRVLALFKLATLLEMSHARYLSGTTDDPFFEEMEWVVPALARRAVEEATG